MRPIWSGSISFGLVSVPVRMYSATESKELRFNFLDRRDMSPIGYEKVSKESGKPVPPDEIVRGFEIQKGQYVPIEDEDLDRLDIELTHSIDICDFVDLDEIDPITSGRPTTCCAGGGESVQVLVKALEERQGRHRQGRVAHTALAALRAYDGRLVLETMYYADEIRQPEAVDGNGGCRSPRSRCQVARENLSDESSRRSTTTTTARSSRSDPREGQGQRAARAAGGGRGRSRRPDGGAARVRRADAKQQKQRKRTTRRKPAKKAS